MPCPYIAIRTVFGFATDCQAVRARGFTPAALLAPAESSDWSLWYKRFPAAAVTAHQRIESEQRMASEKQAFRGPWIIAACFFTFGLSTGFP